MRKNYQEVQDKIKTRLLNDVNKYYRLSIQHYLNNDFNQFTLYAVSAIEKISKALLVDECFIFIFRNNFEDLAAFLEIQNMQGSYQTIGVSESIERVIQIHPKLTGKKNTLQKLAKIRNGEVHLFTAKEQIDYNLFKNYHKYIKECLASLGIKEAEVLKDELINKINELNEEDLNSLEAIVRRKIITAKNYFHKKYMGIPNDKIAELYPSTDEEIEDEFWQCVKCPACNMTGYIEGYMEKGEYDLTLGHKAIPEDACQYIEFYPERFFCNYCDLELGSIDEIKIAEIEYKDNEERCGLLDEYYEKQPDERDEWYSWNENY